MLIYKVKKQQFSFKNSFGFRYKVMGIKLNYKIGKCKFFVPKNGADDKNG
jgi:hypothetical protein